jgi:hypothetical protein
MNPFIKEFFKDLTDDNLHDKVGELLDGIKGNKVSSIQTDIMFSLYNRIFKEKEHTKSCSSCRGRVYNRLKDWYNTNKS